MDVAQIKHALRKLPLDRLRSLDVWLHELIRVAEEAAYAERSVPRKQTLTERTLDNRTFRLERVRCGKEKCKCARGTLHGPYWYSYTRVKDKVKSQYIEKKLPKEIE